MTHNTVLIDMNSIGNAANSTARLTVGDMEVQAIFGVIRTLRGILESYKGWRVWCLWDGQREHSWRKGLLPEYKANRDATTPQEQAKKDSYRKQVQLLRQILPYLGLRQLVVTSAEADDCAGYLTRQILANGGSVVLITGDQDWLQLVQKNVLWIDPIRDRRVSHTDFLEKTGYFSPREFLEGKALQGDGSDNIPGVGGIGEKGAIELLAKYRSVASFLQKYDADPKSIKGKKFTDFAASPAARAAFDRNMKLMNLIDAQKPPVEDVNITRPKFSEDSFRKIAERLAFRSITVDMDRFIRPFREHVDPMTA